MPSTDSGSNNMNTLAERMKAKAEQERMEAENLLKQQFSDLSASLRRSSQHALRTTESAIQQQIETLRQSIAIPCHTLSWAFGKRCLQIILLSASMLLGTSLGAWGIMSYMQHKIASLREETTTLQTARDRIEQDYRQVEAKFKGISLLQSEGKSYIVLPQGYSMGSTGTTTDGLKRQAIEIVWGK